MEKLVLSSTAKKTGINVNANFPNKNEMTPIAATPKYIVNLETSFSFIVSSSFGSTSYLSVEKFKCFEPFALDSIMAMIPRINGIFFNLVKVRICFPRQMKVFNRIDPFCE